MVTASPNLTRLLPPVASAHESLYHTLLHHTLLHHTQTLRHHTT